MCLNNRRRNEIKKAVVLLENAYNIATGACEQEQDCLDNTPENLYYSDRCQNMENIVSNLEDACSAIEEARDLLTEAVG